MEKNLDNIFDRFYPKSQTVEQGIFLKRAAWTVEILLAIVGCSIGLLLILKYQTNPEETTSLKLVGETINNLMMGLIFFMVGVIELTKIPLASAVYYNSSFLRRSVFVVALFLVNVSTFETVVAGFERINNQRTEAFRKLLIKKNTKEAQIIEKRVQVDEKNINKKKKDLSRENESIIKQMKSIEDQATTRKKSIQNTSNQAGTIDTLAENIKRNTEEKEKLSDANIEFSKQFQETGIFKNRKLNDDIQKQIDQNIERITKLNILIREDTESLKKARLKSDTDNEQELSQIDTQTKRDLAGFEENLRENLNLISQYNETKKNLAETNKSNIDEIKILEEEVKEIVEEIDFTGPQNQVIRVASWFKGFFIVDYEAENNKKNKEISELETSKVFQKFLFLRFAVERTDKEIELIDDQISILNDQIILNKNKLEVEKSEGIVKSVYSTIPETALTFAYWVWFGVLSFIVSITGTMLAFASLTLRDPRANQERENYKKRIGLFWWSVRFLSSWTKNIRVRTRQLFKPNIIEKKVEVEVEKVVEKIVEKPVIQEKIIEKEIEVPRQIEKKIFVHVPFPTDDPEVIKKGPMIYNDKDIDKDKKK